MAQAGSIKEISGSVSARTSQGQVRELNVGDLVYENELIETSAGSSVTIELDNGKTIDLSENAQILIDESVIGVVDARDAVVSEVESLQAALEAGEEIGDEEATAVGEEDDGFDYDLPYYAGDQTRGEVGSYLFGTEYGSAEEVIPEEAGEIEEVPEIVPILIIDDQTVNEDAGTMTFTVSMSNPSSQAVTFDYGSADATATAGLDYTALSGTGTIAAGATSTTITVAITDDDISELTENFVMNLTNAVNATIADPQGIGTILDNEEPPPPPPPPELPTLIIDDQTVNEDAGTMTFTVTMSNASSQDVTFDYGSADGTAIAGQDYTALSGTGTIAAGSTSTTITVSITDDNILEPTENFVMNLTNAVNATIADPQGIGTILDNEEPPPPPPPPPPELPTINISDAATVEEGGILAYTVSLNDASDSTVSANLAFGIGTATGTSTDPDAIDYVTKFYSDAGLTNEITSVTFNPGDTSQTVYVSTIDNDPPYAEDNETVQVTLNTIVGATPGVTAGVGIITDGTLPTINISDAATVEEGGILAYTVSLNDASDSTVSANLAFGIGTATGTSTDPDAIDYVTKFYSDAGLTNEITSVTFNPGDTSQTVYVSTIDNDPPYAEDNETVQVTLNTIVGATPGVTAGVGIITDGTLPTINISDAATVEEGGILAYTVSLNDASDSTVSANLAFGIGTATGTSTDPDAIDYVTKFYSDAGLTNEITSVTFNPGDTSQTVYVSTIDNDPPYAEDNETVQVTLNTIVGATPGVTAGVGIITDGTLPLPPEGEGVSLEVDEAAIPDTDTNTVGFTAGSDDLTSFAFSTDLSNLALEVDGDAVDDVVWDRVDGSTITGSVDGTVAITLTMTDPGTIPAGTSGNASVSAVLTDAFPHPAAGGTDSISLGYVDIIATDIDGDEAAAPVYVDVIDDVPTITANYDAILANEQDNSVTASLDIDFGADGADSTTPIQLTGPTAVVDNIAYVTTGTIANPGVLLTSTVGGVTSNLIYNPDGKGGLIAVRALDNVEVFRVSVDPVDETYTVNITGILDGAAGEYLDLTAAGVRGGNAMDYIYHTGPDNDNDGTADHEIRVSAINSEGEADTVNTSTQGMGVGAAQAINNPIAHGSHADLPSDQLIIEFTDISDELPVPYYVSKAEITMNYLSDNETASWTAYSSTGGLVGTGLHNGSEGSILTIETTIPFDSIVLEANDSTVAVSYKVLGITTWCHDEGADLSITYDLAIEDSDGDTASTTFDVTFDADGDITGTDDTTPNEVISGSSGADTIDAGEGNDTIVFDATDSHVDGGLGYDTLLVADTTGLNFSNVDNVEKIDLNAAGPQAVTLSLDDVLDMTDSTNVLEITGGTGDVVTLTGLGANPGEWTQSDTVDGLFTQNDSGGLTVTIVSPDEPDNNVTIVPDIDV